MIRALVASALAAVATLGGLWLAGSGNGDDATAMPFESEFVDVPMIAVPLFERGTVTGYVLAEIAFEADAAALAGLSVPPRAILADALHGFVLGRAVEIGENGPDPGPMREALLAAINERMDGALVRAFVLRLDHLMRADIRDGSLQRRVRRATKVAGDDTGDGEP